MVRGRLILLSRWTAGIAFGCLVCLVVLSLRGAGYLEGVELAGYDWLTRLAAPDAGANGRIVVIGITEKDIRRLDKWPVTDHVLKETLTILCRSNPAVIGLDIFRDLPVPPGTEELNVLLGREKKVIGVMKFGDRGVPPSKALTGTDRIAFNDILVDRDGIVRRALLFMDDGESVFSSFPLRLSLEYLQANGVTPRPDQDRPEHLQLGMTTIEPFEKNDGSYVDADARGYQFLIPYRKESFPVYSLSELLSGSLPPKVFHNKVVLVGVMAESVKDLFYTPHTRGFQSAQPVPGVLLHAQIMGRILDMGLDGRAPMQSLSNSLESVFTLFWGLLGGIMGLRIRSVPLFFMGLSAGLVVLLALAHAAFSNNLWIPLLPPALAWVSSAAVLTAYSVGWEKRRRAALMEIFSKHVSPDVAEDIWRQRDLFLENGRPKPQSLTVTVLFSDLKGYTTISEKMPPASLIDWLNTYLDTMTGAVMDHSGVVDDYVGDGIKANFGVPVPRTTEEAVRRDARNAARCALAMKDEVDRLNGRYREQGLPEIGVRIGICTGSAVAGTVGSSRRMKYTTVGDTVNTAARLEAFDKSLDAKIPCRILISESTRNLMGNGFLTQRLGEIGVKGKDKRVIAYRLLGPAGNEAVPFQKEARHEN